MSTTGTTITSYAQLITDLLQGQPNHDTPPDERNAWLQRKVELPNEANRDGQRTTPAAVDAWTERSEASFVAKFTDPLTSDPHATPCPSWCVEGAHMVQLRTNDRRHESDHVCIPLRYHLGTEMTDGEVQLPTAQVLVVKGWNSVEPSLRLRRYAARLDDNRMGITKGSEYILSIAEATELAHVLLAAVDVATGVQE